MLITKNLVRDKILAYLNHQLTLAELVDWAEDSLCDGELELSYIELLSDILAHLGLADVKEFGLSWDSLVLLLQDLGYQPQVKFVPMSMAA